MKWRNTALRLLFVTMFCLLVSPTASRADDVIIYPGYISGQITTGTANAVVRNITASASGGGYSSSKSVTGNSYTLTVQGGDWNYNVDATATASPPGTSYPYTTLNFSRRTFSVPVGQTVSNNYSATGTVRFQVNITGDPYTTWRAYVYAYKAMPAGQEKTDSSGQTRNAYSPNGIWDMPVVPNEQIRIYAYVRVDNVYYYFWYYSPDYRYETVAPNQTIIIPLNIEHKTPPPPPPPPPPPTYDYGTVQGNVFLNLNVDSQDYSTRFSRHYVSGYYGTNLYTNPGDYLHQNVRTGTYTYRPQTLLNDSGRSFWFYWPYTNGYQQNDYVTVYKDQTTVKDFSQNAGILTGHLKFKGTMNGLNLSYKYFQVNGASDFYVPGQGWVRQITYSGSTSNELAASTDGGYRFFLTPGPWMPYYFDVRASKTFKDVNNKTYTASFQTVFYDYNYYYDGNSNNFGQPAYIEAGTSTVQEREYCAGALTLRFRVDGGGLLSSPYVSGNGSHYNANGKRDMYASTFYASANANKVDSPELDLHGLPGDYVLSTVRVVTEDGSMVYLKPVSVKLECGVWKGRDVSGPDIVINSPAPELITNAETVTVSGTASDDTGVTEITINGVAVPFTPTGNPNVPNEVAFSYTLTTTNGVNTILTKAYDALNHEGKDDRKIYVDRWMPTTMILLPSDGAVIATGSAVPVNIQASDQGYGFTLTVSVDDTQIYVGPGPANDAASETISYSTELGGLSAGPHTITAVVNDLAGNSASTPVTFTLNTPPTVSANGPYTVNEGGAVTVAASGSDPEGGPLAYAWDLDNDGTFETPGQSVTFSAAALDGPGSRTISVKVVDNVGFSATAQTNVDILNVGPTAAFANTSGSILEGGAATVAFTNPYDPGAADTAAGFRHSYDCTNDGTFESADSAGASFACSYADNGLYTVKGRITDKDGGFTDYTATVTVSNVAPTVSAITAPVDPQAVNNTVAASAAFADPGVLDTHTALWEWGDGSASAGLVTEAGGSGAVSGSHSYAASGVYTVKLTVTDKDGGSGWSVYQYAVIYDPSAGFVTGGGWITSPQGAYAADPSLTGKANFGFVAKYHNGAATPDGQTEFQFQTAGLNFHSTSYEWLVVAGTKAQFKGLGTINGSGNYGFMITAIDGNLPGGGDVDKFRVKIWDKDNNDAVVYDNQMGLADDGDPTTALDRGSIVIHKAN